MRRMFMEANLGYPKGGASAIPRAFLTGAQVYDHLEKVVDRFEDVANEISGIVIENV